MIGNYHLDIKFDEVFSVIDKLDDEWLAMLPETSTPDEAMSQANFITNMMKVRENKFYAQKTRFLAKLQQKWAKKMKDAL